MKALFITAPASGGGIGIDPTHAVVRIDGSTICGTDLHILKGDVPETTQGTILATRPWARLRPSMRASARWRRETACWSPV
jgi:hypothetical protein